MTDKERIEQIILDKGLSKQSFCSQILLSQASLSNILSEKTKPTLAILRNILEAFPDIDPLWLYTGQGNMYSSPSSTPQHGGGMSNGEDGTSSEHPADSVTNNNYVLGDLFSQSLSPQDSASGSSQRPDASMTSSSARSAAPSLNGRGRVATPAPNMTSPMQSPSLSDIVRTTLDIVQKPQRKVTEVRIFFDDGTYETFSAKH